MGDSVGFMADGRRAITSTSTVIPSWHFAAEKEQSVGVKASFIKVSTVVKSRVGELVPNRRTSVMRLRRE